MLKDKALASGVTPSKATQVVEQEKESRRRNWKKFTLQSKACREKAIGAEVSDSTRKCSD